MEVVTTSQNMTIILSDYKSLASIFFYNVFSVVLSPFQNINELPKGIIGLVSFRNTNQFVVLLFDNDNLPIEFLPRIKDSHLQRKDSNKMSFIEFHQHEWLLSNMGVFILFIAVQKLFTLSLTMNYLIKVHDNSLTVGKIFASLLYLPINEIQRNWVFSLSNTKENQSNGKPVLGP